MSENSILSEISLCWINYLFREPIFPPGHIYEKVECTENVKEYPSHRKEEYNQIQRVIGRNADPPRVIMI